MNTYLIIFLFSVSSSLALTPLVRRISESFGWLDEPRDERRVHRKAVPRLGGVAIFVTVIAALSLLSLADNNVTLTVRKSIYPLLTVVVPASAVFLFGLYDDLRGVDARLKFTAQGLAAVLLFLMGARVEALSVPFAGSVMLPLPISFALTVLWTVGISNAFNLIDGMDGLSAGAALFASLILLVVSLIFNQILEAVVLVALAGALVGFLRYNFNPASIFLGDCGSLFIGFQLATLSIHGSQKASTAIAVAIPLLAFGVPVVDTGFSMVRRFISGRPLFQGDREHIHHMLLARGWSQRRVSVVLYGACAIFGLSALLFVNDAGRLTGLVLFVIGVAVIIAIGHLRYHEVDEIKAGIKRTVGERRLRTANHIQLRRASRAMSEAKTIGELLGAVENMLSVGEFVYCNMQIEVGNAASIKRALALESKNSSLQAVDVRGGLIRWSWERGDIESSEIIGSDHFWTLRLPISNAQGHSGYINLYREYESGEFLLDVNYLCLIFQREIVRAVERLVAEAQPAGETTAWSAATGD